MIQKKISMLYLSSVNNLEFPIWHLPTEFQIWIGLSHEILKIIHN